MQILQYLQVMEVPAFCLLYQVLVHTMAVVVEVQVKVVLKVMEVLEGVEAAVLRVLLIQAVVAVEVLQAVQASLLFVMQIP